jgi:hypothetical protein
MATSLELAITAIRSNRKEEGRQLLNLLIQENPNNEMAWLWMSSVVNTDEQRARCLYHVLAINPDNQVARRGLQLLGIVVSDSRPVKVPRDSQPIKIPTPSPPNTQFIPTDTQPLKPEPAPKPTESESAPAGERRPFRIDPQTIVDELPFKPITKPFTETPQPSDSSEVAVQSLPVAQSSEQVGQVSSPSAPGPVAQASDAPEAGTPAQPVQATAPGEQTAKPSEPVPVVQPGTVTQGSGQTANLSHSSQPVPVAQTNVAPDPGMAPQAQPQPPATGPLQPGMAQQASPDTGALQNPAGQPGMAGMQPMNLSPQAYPPQATPAPQQFVSGTVPPSDTRPSQPVPIVTAQPASQPAPVVHSNVTMGMPTQNVPAQGYSQPVSPAHANTTMGMPVPGQPPGPATGQMPHPSEPVQAIHSNTTMGMPAYGQPQQPLPQNQALHSNSTVMMPTGADPSAMPPPPGQAGMVDYRMANTAYLSNDPKSSQPQDKDGEGEEINILAVIIFGSLSVTALGGLGMLILLMFTA